MNNIRFIPLQHLGWGFLLAWVFCVFYTGTTSDAFGVQDMHSRAGFLPRILELTVPVGSAIATIAALMFAERAIGTVAAKRAVVVLSPAACALATPLLVIPCGNGALDGLLFALGALISGVGSGVMWVFWGEFYARLSQSDVESTALASSVLAAGILLAVSAMSGWVALAVTVCLPLASGALFSVSWRETSTRAASRDHAAAADLLVLEAARERNEARPLSVVAAVGKSGWGILLACSFACIAGSLATETPSMELLQPSILASVALLVALGFASTRGPRRISIAFLYRWICPVLVVGFCAGSVLGSSAGSAAAFGTSLAVRFALCLITQMYFARFSARGLATPTQSYGLGWILVHTGDLIGVLLAEAVWPALQIGTITADQAFAVCAMLLVVISMFFIGSDGSFASLDSVARRDGKAAPAPVGAAGESSHSPLEPETPKPASGLQSENLDHAIEELADRFDLTPRERDIFALLMRGRSVPYIRDELVISLNTVSTHVKHIYAKAAVHSRQELLDLLP